MNLSKWFLIFLYIIKSIVDSKVIFVFELIRHGARSPLIIKNQKDVLGQEWKVTIGELTVPGMRQVYLGGLLLKNKYIDEANLLKPDYDPNEIYLYASNKNTIQTAYAHLKGIYPFRNENLTDLQKANALPPIDITDKDDILNLLENMPLPFNSQTLSVHVLDNNHPFMLDLKCFKSVGKTNVENSLAMKNETDLLIASFNNDFKINLSISLNLTDSDFLTWGQISSYNDAFAADDFDKRDLTYLNVDLIKFNETAKQVNSQYYKMFDNTSLISRITVTPIIYQILTYMRIQMDGLIGPKMVIFSAHDINIMYTLNFLKIALKLDNLFFTNIVFAANIIFELNVADDNVTYSINIIYNDNVIYNDSLDLFNSSFVSYAASDIEINNFCLLEESKFKADNLFYYIILVTLILVIIGLIIFLLKMLELNEDAKNDDFIDSGRLNS